MAFWPAPKFEGLDQYDQKAGVANAQIEHNLTNASVARAKLPGELELQKAELVQKTVGSPFQQAEAARQDKLRRDTTDQTKQIAMARLDQSFYRDLSHIQDLARKAASDEEKFHWKQEQDKLVNSRERARLEIAQGRYTYDTGNIPEPFQGKSNSVAPIRADMPTDDSAQALALQLADQGKQVAIRGPQPSVGPSNAVQAPTERQPTAMIGGPEPTAPPPISSPNMDPRDFRAQGGAVAPTAAPVADMTVAPQQPRTHVVMPEFVGSPRERASAKNAWMQAQSKAQQKELNLSGGRESVQNNRILSAGNQVAAALKNIVDVPISGASTGIFGERGHPTGLFGAGKETLANAMTTQEVNDYKIMATGIQRSLAAIESAGLAATGALSNQMESVLWREGWTNFSKLRALAETRQIVEKGLEVQLSNPRVPPETKELVRQVIKDAQTAVPFTHSDLTTLQAQQKIDPKITIADIVASKSTGGWDNSKEKRLQELKAKLGK